MSNGVARPPLFTCPVCGKGSHSPLALRAGFCGPCDACTACPGTEAPHHYGNTITAPRSGQRFRVCQVCGAIQTLAAEGVSP
jgi:hypothetical protein